MLTEVIAQVELPETLRFLNLGWWILHIIAIIVVGGIGFIIGKNSAKKPGPDVP